MIVDKINKLALPATIIIASLILGGFFYASQENKQKSIEKQQQIKLQDDRQQREIKIEQKKQEQLAKEFKEEQAKEEAKQALDTCIGSADENYNYGWWEECKAQGKLTSKCIEIGELTFDEYLKKYGLTSEEYVKERNLTPSIQLGIISDYLSARSDYISRWSECSCRLLVSTADRFNESLEKDKAECFKRYPQN